MKILLIGANGQLATDLIPALRCAGHQMTGLTRDQLDIRDAERTKHLIADARPGLVINTAAFHNVDLCEDQPAEAVSVNGAAVGRLAELCKKYDCALLHFSTDFVFDGDARTPYKETDKPHPLSVYAKSKLEGER